MKRNYLKSTMLVGYALFATNGILAQEYCPQSVEYGVEPITLVEIGTISNATSEVVNGTPGYEDFTNLSTDVVRGQTYTLRIKGNTVNNIYEERVFIDWNHDFVFDISTEKYVQTMPISTGTDNIEVLIQIQVPADAQLGQTRLRVIHDLMNDYNYEEEHGVPMDACVPAYYGQVEDYTLNIVENSNANPCAVQTELEENFDDFDSFPSNCWSASVNSFPSISLVNSDGDKAVQSYSGFITDEAAYIVSPELSNIDALHYVTFDVKNATGVDLATLEIGTLAEADDYTSFVSLETLDYQPNSSISTEVFSNVPTNHKFVALKWTHAGGHKVLQIDNFVWNNIETSSVVHFDKGLVNIYPNPTHGLLNIQTDVEIQSVKIYDAVGKEILSTSERFIDVSYLTSGVYVVKVASKSQQVASYKIIKK